MCTAGNADASPISRSRIISYSETMSRCLVGEKMVAFTRILHRQTGDVLMDEVHACRN